MKSNRSLQSFLMTLVLGNFLGCLALYVFGVYTYAGNGDVPPLIVATLLTVMLSFLQIVFGVIIQLLMDAVFRTNLTNGGNYHMSVHFTIGVISTVASILFAFSLFGFEGTSISNIASEMIVYSSVVIHAISAGAIANKQ